MLKYNDKRYYSPQEAINKFGLAQSTIYYWADTNAVNTLDLEAFCEGLPLEKMELRSQVYIEESELKNKAKEMKQ